MNGIELQPLDVDDGTKLSDSNDSPDSIVVNGIQLRAVKSIPHVKAEAPRKISSVAPKKRHAAEEPPVYVNGVQLQPIEAADEDEGTAKTAKHPALVHALPQSDMAAAVSNPPSAAKGKLISALVPSLLEGERAI